MSKTFNAFEKATIKNTAREVARLAAKQEKLREQVKLYAEKIEAEIKEIDETIVQYEENVQKITGGYSASELCEKVSRGSQNDWVFKYPDTILPVTEGKKEEEKKEEEEKAEQDKHLYQEEVTLKDVGTAGQEAILQTEVNDDQEEIPEFTDEDSDFFKDNEF